MALKLVNIVVRPTDTRRW